MWPIIERALISALEGARGADRPACAQALDDTQLPCTVTPGLEYPLAFALQRGEALGLQGDGFVELVQKYAEVARRDAVQSAPGALRERRVIFAAVIA